MKEYLSRVLLSPRSQVSWHSDGKQFMTSHSDGSIATWNLKVPNKPVAVTFPHCESSLIKDLMKNLCENLHFTVFHLSLKVHLYMCAYYFYLLLMLLFPYFNAFLLRSNFLLENEPFPNFV